MMQKIATILVGLIACTGLYFVLEPISVGISES